MGYIVQTCWHQLRPVTTIIDFHGTLPYWLIDSWQSSLKLGNHYFVGGRLLISEFDCYIWMYNENWIMHFAIFYDDRWKWSLPSPSKHDDVIKWKHFPPYWPFVRGIHRSPVVNSPHKGQWRGAFMFSLISGRKNCWVNNRDAGDLGRYRAQYDVIVMI